MSLITYHYSSHIHMSSSTSLPPYHPAHHSSTPPSPAPPYRAGASTTELRNLPPAYISDATALPRPVTALPQSTSFLSNIRGRRVPRLPRFRTPRFPGIRFTNTPRRNLGYDFYIAAQARVVDPRATARSRMCTIIIFFSGLLICLVLLVVITQLQEATTGRS